MMCTQNSLRTSPGRAIPGHVPGARPKDEAMQASADRLNFKTHGRQPGSTRKKLRVATSKEKTDASDRLTNYSRRIDGMERCLNGKFHGKFCRNREREQKLHIGTWNVTSLIGKEPKLVHEAISYWLDIVRVSSTK